MDEFTTRALLDQVLADAPAPAPIDLNHVVGLAHRYQRRRSQLMTAAAAVLVLVITTAVTALTSEDGGSRAAPPASRPPIEALHDNPEMLHRTAPALFDVKQANIQVSGVPATMTDIGTASERSGPPVRRQSSPCRTSLIRRT